MVVGSAPAWPVPAACGQYEEANDEIASQTVLRSSSRTSAVTGVAAKERSISFAFAWGMERVAAASVI